MYIKYSIDYILFDISHLQFSTLFYIAIWIVLLNGSNDVNLKIFVSIGILILIIASIRTKMIKLIEQ